MVRRLIVFMMALVLAIAGTGAVLAYVRQSENRALADQAPVEVLVAKGTIPAGMTAQAASDKGLLTKADLPKKSVPPGALVAVTTIKDQVAVSDVFAGEVLLAPKFTDRQTTGSLTIPPGKMAISVQLGDPQRVAGFVLPGSEVAIFNTFEARKATVKVEATGPSTATAEAEATDETTRLLLPRVTVVAVGEVTLRPSTTDGEKKATGKGEEEKPITTAVLTVAATQEEAEKLVHAAQTGELYIGLLNGESKTGPSDGVNNLTLFASEVG